MQQEALIELKGIKTHFPNTKTVFGRPKTWIKAVDNVSLDIMRGECLGLVGESGCGKSTLGRAILRLAPLTSGTIAFCGDEIGHLNDNNLRPYRPRMQMVFQDPRASLNPRMKVVHILKEALNICPDVDKKENFERSTELLDMVDLRPEHLFRYPHEFSGGQQQRICIARALATQPEFLVFDEATSALDVSVQAQIINLMASLRDKLGLTYLFISHDLSIMEHVCNRVAVMYAGSIVEIQDAKSLFMTPRHPYSKALRDALPIADPARRHELHTLPGEVPKLTDPPSGCTFHPRCSYATDICTRENPPILFIGEGNWVRCHHHEELWRKGSLQ
jgi:oligopeptide/dipeptide ABC transporter ATP-binding protein